MRSIRTIITAATLLIVSACGGDKATSPAPVASVAITPASLTLKVGDSQSLSATLTDAKGSTLTGRTVTWNVADGSIAQVSASGSVTAVAPGQTTVTASAEGVSARTQISVLLLPTLQLTVNRSRVFAGDSVTVDWTAANATSCAASGGWTGPRPTNGSYVFSDNAGGVKSFTLSCVGEGGSVSQSASLTVRMPLFQTSYENAKNVGVTPKAVPVSALARAYADFTGRGNLDFVTFGYTYTEKVASPSKIQFWRAEGAAFVEDKAVQVRESVSPCVHPRKALVADFNRDRRPDVFVACHGYDYPPFPGERNQVLLSTDDGRYELKYASDHIGFWHGASAADINFDGAPDVIAATDAGRIAYFINNGDGSFRRDPTFPLTNQTNAYYNLDLLDVNEDGKLDLFLGGHEWEANTQTVILIGDGTYRFTGERRVIPPIPGVGGVVNDVLVTGTGASRSIWLSRTSGGGGSFYRGFVLQRFSWVSGASVIEAQNLDADWTEWLIAYTKGSASCIGGDNIYNSIAFCR